MAASASVSSSCKPEEEDEALHREHLETLSPFVLIPANLLFLAVPLAYFLVPSVRVRMNEQNTWPFERSTASGRACVRLAHSSVLACFFLILFIDWLTFIDTRTSFRNLGFSVLAPLMLVSIVLSVLTPLFAWPRWALYSKFKDDQGLVQAGIQWLRERRSRPRHPTPEPEVSQSPAEPNISDDD